MEDNKAPLIPRTYRGFRYFEVKWPGYKPVGYTIAVMGGKFTCYELHDMKEFIDMLHYLKASTRDEEDEGAI